MRRTKKCHTVHIVEKRQVKRTSFVPIVALTYLSPRSHADAKGDPERARVLDLLVQVVDSGERFQVRYS